MIELLNIDCMKYMATQPENAFDLAIVDPPYGIGIAAGARMNSDAKKLNARKTWDANPPPKGIL